ncbi:helix-turn-helix domain-containing protein [Amycolatopsis jejuensis]|uniref:helix-turn-helix domain-containing protein n=1 Tax=Amycolatopsis jejuensis TaxID=330084 RepID=UPI0005260375|nr:helix-turn-helix domain-containing protein [Amycolatopsis jejuensis]
MDHPAPGAHLESLVSALSDALLEVVLAPAGLGVGVSDVAMYDPDDVSGLSPGTIALGVGIRGPADLAAALYELGRAGVAALCVKLGGGLDERSRQAAKAAGVAVLAVPRGASWLHLAVLMRSLLFVRTKPGEDPAGTDGNSLFAIADTATDLIGGPVTIEDESLRVLAFSVTQGEIDVGRRETILGRRVPERWVSLLREQDILHRVYSSRDPIYFEIDGMRPRVACAIRAGDDLLGSMWAVVSGPVGDAQLRQFREAAAVAALHLLRDQAMSRATRRAHATALIALLFGRGGEVEAAERFGLAGKRLRVLAIEPADRNGRERSVERHWSALELFLASYRVAGAVAGSGRMLYAVVAVDEDDTASLRRTRELATNYASMGGRKATVRIGIGGAAGVHDAERSRREAEDSLRVLTHDGHRGLVAAIDDVRPVAVLHRVLDSLGPDDLDCLPLRRLEQHDTEHQTAYLETLSTLLIARGDITVAAERLHIHANTVRYRLRKLQEMFGLDLDGVDEWLGLSLVLAARSYRRRTAG